MRSWRPFCCGFAGRDPLRLNPGLDHPDRSSSDSPPTPIEATANRQPERSLSGRPNSREGGGQHRPDMLAVGPGQRLTAQKIAAHRVGERQRFATGPSPVTNQPLKSMHYTSLAAPQWAKGALEGGLLRRILRFTVRPSRSNRSLDRARLPASQSKAPRRSRKARQRSPGRMGPAHRKEVLRNFPNRLRTIERLRRAIEQTLNPASR